MLKEKTYQDEVVEFVGARGGSTEIVNVVPYMMRRWNIEEAHTLRRILTMVSTNQLRLSGSEYHLLLVALPPSGPLSV